MSYYSEARAVFLDGCATDRETAMRLLYSATLRELHSIPLVVLNQAANLVLGKANTFVEELSSNNP